MEREIKKDPWEKRLKPVTQDEKTRGYLPPWLLRSFESNANYLDPKTLKTGGKLNYGTVVVKSQWWPGSFTFYNSGRTQHIYCGDGLKHELATISYYPVNPPMMLEEGDERRCYDEPNPTEEWL